ncbi:Mediator of RNA polymerase II transcription subunit 6 [Mortierella sp. GBA43]|nr:Mediator of RNA polymerase II transcription subunit 6 [Mortierella sp. GBA43]
MFAGNQHGGASGNNASNAEQNLLNMEWRFHEWILGVGGLNPDNVLDYFALSPFWDPECNNAVLRMQTQFNNLGEMKQRLSEMTGVEFALVHDRFPTLFVIQKQRRRSPQEVKPMAIYYVLHGSIYQCPDLQTLLSNRILGSLHHVESAFNEARVMTEFHPSTGYHWKSITTEDPSSTTASASTAAGSSSSSGGGSGAAGGAGAAGTSGSSTTSTLPGSAAGAPTPGAVLSPDFLIAVDRAIKNVDQRAQMQQLKLQSGNAAASSSSAAANGLMSDKVKQEGSSSSAAARNVPKTANKRKKKSEEASAAAVTMGLNTAVGIGSGQQVRSPSVGPGGILTSPGGLPAMGGVGTPGTPTGAPPKRRKKTKTLESK